MNLVMTRVHIDLNGAFSTVTDENGQQVMVCASHTYLQPDGVTFAPVVGQGTYTCVRGQHALLLDTGLYRFETFEITGLSDHTGVLFHFGNLPETQSEGCELVGNAFGSLSGLEAVLNSDVTFQRFMAMQAGVDEFQLTVK